MTDRIIVGITGASAQILAIETLRALKDVDIEVHLIATDTAKDIIEDETSISWADVEEMADIVHSDDDMFASVASGSYKTLGMIVIPCSMATLAEIANGVASTLLTRAADVTLKERRKLVLVTRETPLSYIHLKNMSTVTKAGGVILPPMITMYSQPASIEDMARHVVGKVLDQFGIEHDLYRRWA
jgi:polyprenyl P-hydroxybenzoate/phenylacrylic acid decarboxylase-like protein